MASGTNTGEGAAPPPVAMFQLINGYRMTQALYVAAKLGIADLLADGPKTPEALAAEAGANAGALYRILRALASEGVFEEAAGRRFVLTPLAETLRSDHPGSMRPFAIFLGQDAYPVWAELLYSARTGAPAFDHLYGVSHFEYLAQHAEAAAVFNASMSANVARSVASTVSAYAFPATGVVVDVGGGHGMFIAAILQANPGLRGVLFDMPHVVEGAASILEEAGVADRCARVGGDFFTTPLPPGDIYTLRQIIHDWDDERSLTILRNCAQAMAPGGKILVIEAIIPPGNEPSRIKFLDLQMLVMTGGLQRTEEEYREMYATAGLRLTRVIPTSTEFSIVEGVRAE